MTSYHQFHLNLLKLGYNNLIKQEPFCQSDTYVPEAEEVLNLFREVIEGYQAHQDEAYQQGQQLMTRLIRVYPQYTELFARDLLWLFGGDCIHYLSDEEIEQFQQLDEAFHAASSQSEACDYLQLRTLIFDSGSTH